MPPHPRSHQDAVTTIDHTGCTRLVMMYSIGHSMRTVNPCSHQGPSCPTEFIEANLIVTYAKNVTMERADFTDVVSGPEYTLIETM